MGVNREDGIGVIPFREKLDIAQTFLRQLDRTNQAASYDYENSVRQKLNQLPLKWRKWVLSQPELYEEERVVWVYKAPTGLRIGTPEAPTLINDRIPVRRLEGPVDWTDPNIKARKNTGTKDEPTYELLLLDESKPVRRLEGPIDWGDPNIISPKPKLRTFTDYSLLDATIMDAAESAGLTWNVDEMEVDAGDTAEFIHEYIERAKTPFLPKKLVEEQYGLTGDAEDDEEKEDDEEEG